MLRRERGARLRLGFFIGFDEPDRTACLLRSRHAVTTVRMDVAYVELVARDGTILAKHTGPLDERQARALAAHMK